MSLAYMAGQAAGLLAVGYLIVWGVRRVRSDADATPGPEQTRYCPQCGLELAGLVDECPRCDEQIELT